MGRYEGVFSFPRSYSIYIDSHPKSQFVYCGLLNIESQSLGVECTYTYFSNDMDKYKRNHHAINMDILDALAEMGLEMAPRFTHAGRLIPPKSNTALLSSLDNKNNRWPSKEE